MIEPVTIEKHVEKGHVTHVESNGVNKPDHGNRYNMCPENTVAASFFFFLVQKPNSVFTNKHNSDHRNRFYSSKKYVLQKK